MPLYEFNNRETGESVGELHLTIEAMEELLEMNPHLCVRPGILRFAQFKTVESFPSYPEIDNQTRSESDKNEKGEWTITEPASWNDSKPDSHKTGIKITDKRKNKISHFDEDIKNYGKIVGTPTLKVTNLTKKLISVNQLPDKRWISKLKWMRKRILVKNTTRISLVSVLTLQSILKQIEEPQDQMC